MKSSLSLLLLVFPILSCIERFDLTLPRKADILLVEGLLADHPDYQYVKLYLTNGQRVRVPISGALLMFEEQENTQFMLHEVAPGEYRPLLGELDLKQGKKFRLIVSLGDSMRVESDWEEVPVAVPIGEVTLEPVYITFVNENGVFLQSPRVRVSVNSGVLPADSVFLRWTYENTYGYEAPFAPPFCVECAYCYVKEHPKEVLSLARADNGFGKTIDNQHVDYLPITERFNIRNAVLVKQLSINKPAYDYYQLIDQQKNARGRIFDPPPAVLTGNLSEVSGSGKNVYGFFEVARYREASKYILSHDTGFLIPTFISRCLAELQVGNTSPDCFDCREREGAGKVAPDYF